MESKVVSLVTALFLALLMGSDLGISTVVTGQRIVPSASVASQVPAREAEDDQRLESHSTTDSSNLKGCAHQPAEDELKQFTPCIPAVSIISVAPTTECCNRLQASGRTCLCSLFARYRSQIPDGVVTIQKITELPMRCKISVPEGYVCDGIAIPSSLDSTDTADTLGLWFPSNP